MENLTQSEIIVSSKWRFCSSSILAIAALIFFINSSYAAPPSTPANFYALVNNKKVELHWSENAEADLKSYKIYRSLDSINFILINTINATGSSNNVFVDNNLNTGQNYYYQISALNNSNEESTKSFTEAVVPEEDFGNFLSLDGNGDYLEVKDNDEHAIRDFITVEFWVRLKATVGSPYFLAKYTTTLAEPYKIGLNASKKVDFRINNLPSGPVSTSSLLPNKWYHIAATYDGAIMKIYINGILEASFARTGLMLSSLGGKLLMGADEDGSLSGINQYLNGMMDEVRIWNYARTEDSILANMCNRLKGNENGLVGIWHFDEKNKKVAYDNSPFSNNGVLKADALFSNFKPLPKKDFITLNENETKTIDVQSNDIDPANGTLKTSIITSYPKHGIANLINDDEINYTPSPGFTGIDTIKYIVNGDPLNGICNSKLMGVATVVINVKCIERSILEWKNFVNNDLSTFSTTFQGLATNFETDFYGGVGNEIIIDNSLQSSYALVLRADMPTNSQKNKISFKFNQPPNQLCFDLKNIDSKAGAYSDHVSVKAFHNGTLLTLSTENFTLGSAVNFEGNNSFTGLTTVLPQNSEGNVAICFFEPVDSVIIVMGNASTAPVDPSLQAIGIGNFSWCELENNPPEITSADPENPSTDIINTSTPQGTPVTVCVNVSEPDGDKVTAHTPVADSGQAVVEMNINDTCFTYTPSKEYTGTDIVKIIACDDRNPSLCDTVIINIQVIPVDGPNPPPPADLLISEGLSPNEDGTGDHWIIKGIETYPDNNIRIFNRWGNPVFDMKGYNEGDRVWKGESNKGLTAGNVLLPDGTYYYLIDLGNNKEIIKGFVVLKK